jgi:uncharacterized membrane protein HdeD (DUF308 family)
MAGSTISPPVVGHQRSGLRWPLALAVLLLIFGVAGIGVATFMELTSVLVFGPMLLVSAAIQAVVAFFEKNRKESILHFAASGLEAALGFWIMAQPFENIVDLVMVLAIFFLVSGIIRLGRSLVTRSPGRGWTVAAGVVALVLGACVWLRWPDSRWWFLGLCIALDFLCRGVTWSALAMSTRKPDPTAI